jgi:hypothetical protein
MFSEEDLSQPRLVNRCKKKLNLSFFTYEEDQVLLHHVAKFGTTWEACARKIPRRTANAVKNRHARLLKGFCSDSKIYSCRMCGVSKRGHVCLARSYFKNQKNDQEDLETLFDKLNTIDLQEVFMTEMQNSPELAEYFLRYF